MEQKIINLLAEILGIAPEDITAETDLTSENNVEPISLAKLVMACERAFGITIHDEYVHTFVRVKDLLAYIAEQIDLCGDAPPKDDRDRSSWYYRAGPGPITR